MIFSKKEEIVTPYTVEQCNSCKAISKRKFIRGDYVFKNTNSCKSCNGQMLIINIFGETSRE